MSISENQRGYPEEDRTDADWRIGTATRVITPDKSMRMSGFAGCTDPSDGTLMDIHAKAIAFEDYVGQRAVIVSTEVLLIARELRTAVEERIEDEYRVDPEALVLNASHTHYGPEFWDTKFKIYGMNETERERFKVYYERLKDELVTAVGEVPNALKPALYLIRARPLRHRDESSSSDRKRSSVRTGSERPG